MEKEEIKKIEERISSLKMNGEEIPKHLYDFIELSDFNDFDDLKSQIINNEYSLFTPDHLLYTNFKYVAPSSHKKLANFFLYLPYIIAIILTIICIANNNYFGLALLPIVYFSNMISGIFKNPFISLGLLIFGLISVFNKLCIGSILLIIGITIQSSIYIRVYRRMGFHYAAMQSEKIFTFLFYSRNISLIHNSTLKIIKSI